MVLHDPKAAFATAEVIARRMPLIWWVAVGPNPARQAEMVRMVAEKNVALLEGMAAANFKLASEAFALWGKVMTGALSHDAVPQAMARIAHASTVPAARRVKVNRRRLRRKG